MKRSINGEMPDESGIRGHLRKFRGAKAFEIPVTDSLGRTPGNHGDFLMIRVYREIAEDNGIKFTSTVEDADILVVRPGGALLEQYAFPVTLRDRLQEYPDLPLVIFPSSTLFQKTDPGFIFEGRSAPTLLLLREEYSYRQLESKWLDSLSSRNVSIELDHDVVASGHARVQSVLEDIAGSFSPRQNGTLVAARLDVEAHPIAKGFPEISRSRRAVVNAYKKLPEWGRVPIRKRVVARRQRSENQLLIKRLIESREYRSDEPIIPARNSRDLSDQTLTTFSQYARSILEAKRVITNRLHIALPAAALGTETYLVDSGYHKLRGVYERSLSRNLSVCIVPTNE